MAKKNDEWKKHLAELGWSYWKSCTTCSGSKKYYRRGTDVMVVYAGRDYYTFTENKVKKSGKLSQLDSVVKAAKAAKAQS